MIRLIIVCEGETEKQFCDNLLAPHFFKKGISLSAPLIKKTNGGICPWPVLKRQLIGHLHEGAYVTTFIDYYGIKDSMLFPKWAESKKVSNKTKRMHLLEKAMTEDLDSTLRQRFIPYLQLHEFEALLFCDIKAFTNEIPNDDIKDIKGLKKVLQDFPNPELINDNIKTSPSHRLEQMISGYTKTLYGAVLAQATGLKTIREKCPLFSEWLNALEILGKVPTTK